MKKILKLWRSTNTIYVRFKRLSCVKNDTQTFNLIGQRNRTLIYFQRRNIQLTYCIFLTNKKNFYFTAVQFQRIT